MTLRLVAALAAAMLVIGSHASAQDAGCRPTDANAEGLRQFAVRLATDPSARMEAKRQRYSLVPVAATEVQIVTDPQTCATAARKFKHGLGESGKSDRQVYVVRVGDRYIVYDPTAKAGEFEVHMVFDKHFKLLASFAG